MGSRADTNLLLISFDQWRGDWADPGAPVLQLPALQSLASEGWSARRCYTSSPHCVPARMSWLTGLDPSQLGVTRNADVSLPADAPSLVRDLQQRGWHTAVVGKTHWTSHFQTSDLRQNGPLLNQLGFDQACDVAGPRALRRVTCDLTEAWRQAGLLEAQQADLQQRYGQGRSAAAWSVRPSLLPNPLYPDLWIAERGLKALQAMPSDQPWLLWVSFVGPHEPFDTPPPWHGRHRADALPAATPQPDWIADLPDTCELSKCARSWSGRLSQKQIEACRADYADHLSLLDDQIQRLLTGLERRPDQASTAVLATADHGDMLGDGGMLYKGSFLEGAIRVPFIYRPPAESRTGSGIQSKRALPLTGLLREVLQNLSAGGTLKPLRHWASQQPGAVVEFGEERLFIRGARKLCLDASGQPLWATHIGNDPDEQRNRIGALHQSQPRWIRLLEWAGQEQLRRSTGAWIWRNLTNA